MYGPGKRLWRVNGRPPHLVGLLEDAKPPARTRPDRGDVVAGRVGAGIQHVRARPRVVRVERTSGQETVVECREWIGPVVPLMAHTFEGSAAFIDEVVGGRPPRSCRVGAIVVDLPHAIVAPLVGILDTRPDLKKSFVPEAGHRAVSLLIWVDP